MILKPHKIAALAAIIISSLVPAAAQAETIHRNVVFLEDGRYYLQMEVDLEANINDVRTVLSDYTLLQRTNNSIKKLTITPHPDDTNVHVVDSEIHVCVAFFCKDLKQQQHMQWHSPNELRAAVIPANSDFKYGSGRWVILEKSATITQLFFVAEMEPDFWVPPLIGPYMITEKMEEEGIETSQAIEKEASDLATARAADQAKKAQAKTKDKQTKSK